MRLHYGLYDGESKGGVVGLGLDWLYKSPPYS